MEPFRIKMVEPLPSSTRAERAKILKTVGYNFLRVPAKDAIINLVADSGTAAMSQNQWSAMFVGDESYKEASSYEKFASTVQQITGMYHVFPVHQGRGAEQLVCKALVTTETVCFGNSIWPTTRANIIINGGQEEILKCSQEKTNPFNGDMDAGALEQHLAGRVGKSSIVIMQITNNNIGGQPVSMSNIRTVADICKKYDVMYMADACRFAENAWFIKQREPGYSSKSPLEISREMFSFFDGVWVSAKKDGLCNTGGFLALKQNQCLSDEIEDDQFPTEGGRTYGGMTGRDMEAVSVGLMEGLEEAYLKYRIETVERFANILKSAGVPVVEPIGGSSIYINASEMLPHITNDHLPAWTLSCAMFIEGGIVTLTTGFMIQEGDTSRSEMVRLSIPRRVYTVSHYEHVADTLAQIMKDRHRINGVEVVERPAKFGDRYAIMRPVDSDYFE